MKAVVTVSGTDRRGIIAKVSGFLSEKKINIEDISQTIMGDCFAMIMMVDISRSDIPFTDFSDRLKGIGEEMGLSIHAMHEDIFNTMHHV